MTIVKMKMMMGIRMTMIVHRRQAHLWPVSEGAWHSLWMRAGLRVTANALLHLSTLHCIVSCVLCEPSNLCLCIHTPQTTLKATQTTLSTRHKGVTLRAFQCASWRHTFAEQSRAKGATDSSASSVHTLPCPWQGLFSFKILGFSPLNIFLLAFLTVSFPMWIRISLKKFLWFCLVGLVGSNINHCWHSTFSFQTKFSFRDCDFLGLVAKWERAVGDFTFT